VTDDRLDTLGILVAAAIGCDEDRIKINRDVVSELVDALREAKAEIAAYQGRPEGALEGWTWDGALWACQLTPDGVWPQVNLWVEVDAGEVTWEAAMDPGEVLAIAKNGRAYGDDVPPCEDVRGTAPTPREGMRQAKAAAKAKGWTS
jgi:hypothetical protein